MRLCSRGLLGTVVSVLISQFKRVAERLSLFVEVLKTGHDALSRWPKEQSRVAKAKQRQLFGDVKRASKLLSIPLLVIFLALAISGIQTPPVVAITHTVSFTQTGSTDGLPTVTWQIDGGSEVSHSVPYDVSVDDGSSISYTYENPVAGATGVQYVRTDTSPTSPLTDVTTDVTVTGTYTTQFYIAVTSDHGSPTQSSQWVNAASDFTVSVTAPDVVTPDEDQWSLTGLTVDGAPQTVSDTVSFTAVDATHAIEFDWTEQFYITVTSDHDAPTPTTGWYDAGSVTASVTSPADASDGTRYACTGWTGTGSVPSSGSDPTVTFTLTEPSTITWNWKTQYQLVVTSAHGSPTGAGWYDSGVSATFGVTSPDVSGGTRYVFTGWSSSDTGGYTGTDVSTSVTMNNAITETADWKTQYYLTVNSAHGTAGGADWYDSGLTPSATVSPLTVPGATGVQYVFTGWSGDATGTTSPSNAITMNAPKTATANWKTQYQLTMKVSPSGAGTTSPSAGTTWRDAGTVSISATAFSGYAFSSWTGIGTGKYTGPTNLSTITMGGPITETANFAPNRPPVLSSGSVSPVSGKMSMIFTYLVTYYDPEGAAPTINRVWIDGVSHDMTLYRGTASYGVYRYQTTLAAGSHTFYFAFSDGVNTVRLPLSGSYRGPTVS